MTPAPAAALTDAGRAAVAAVDKLGPALIELSHRIHAHPELAFEERQASGWVAGFLRDRGHSVEQPYLALDTALRSEAGAGRPAIAIIAEYDALPGLGHACGHNIIATAAVGAALAVAEAIASGDPGRVVLIGAPAEEVGGGKALLLQRGAFDDIDAAIMVHPAHHDLVLSRTLGMMHFEVRYSGRSSHAAAAPHLGRNALDAMIIAYNAISVLRQQLRDDARVHGVITEGGYAANIIPERVTGSFMVRAAGNDYLYELQEKVINCFRAGALATGCEVDIKAAEAPYLAMNSNPALGGAYLANLRAIGRAAPQPDVAQIAAMGSTDMGNVSWAVPAIHPWLAVSPAGVSIHTSEFEALAAAPEGDRAVIDGAKTLALTAIDALTRPALLAEARRQFEESGAGR